MPIQFAIERTGRVLFKPFDIGKWFVLGFCAFLAYLGEGGGSGGGGWNVPGGGGGGGGGGAPGPTTQPGGGNFGNWVSNNLTWIIVIGVLAVLTILIVILLITWLKARGRFMFIDGIVRNRGAVVEPWKQYQAEGNSLFIFWVALTLAGMILFLAVAALCLAIAWPDIQKQQWGSAATTALIAGILIWIPLGIFLALFNFFLKHFMVPVMYIERCSAIEAMGVAWRELVAPNLGPVILYILMRILIAIAIGAIAFLATCLTCCIAAIPYIGTVILLPLYVFDQSYSLYFIEGFGPQWAVFTGDEDGPRCPKCGYDTRYATSGVCPECGQDVLPGRVGDDGPPPTHPSPTRPPGS